MDSQLFCFIFEPLDYRILYCSGAWRVQELGKTGGERSDAKLEAELLPDQIYTVRKYHQNVLFLLEIKGKIWGL